MGIYKDLDVYKKAYSSMICLYESTKDLPHYLQFDIGQDMRRAARSVPSNICEGYSRNKSQKDIANFLRTALGSNDEVLFNLQILVDLNIENKDIFLELINEYKVIGRQLTNLLRSLNN